MYCPDCGAGARDDANYCLSCGYDLTGERRRAHPDDDGSPAPEPDATARVDVASDPSAARTQIVRQPPQAGADLRPCPACEAPNVSHRVNCGRCGADLDSGEAQAPTTRSGRSARPEIRRRDDVRVRADDGAADGPTPDRRGRRRAPGIAIVAVGAVLGVGLGWAVLSGPLSGGDATVEEAPPSFDPAVYPGVPQRLDVASIEASSTQVAQGETRYEGSLLFDRDTATAWNSQGVASEDDVGEFLRIRLTDPAWVSRLLVANGYQKDDERYFGNARVRRVELAFDDGNTFDVTLLDQQGMQSIDLPFPVLAERVTIRIHDSYSGSTYRDVAVSEIEILGHPAVGVDAERFGDDVTPP